MKKLVLVLVIGILWMSQALAQPIRLEAFLGNHAPSIDVFWIKPLAQESPFLFLNRNRYSVPGYSSEQGQFSTLNILAYQWKETGWGVAVAGTASGQGAFQARTGVQFLKSNPGRWLLYSIASAELGRASDFRWLTIYQTTPRLSDHLNLLVRLEWVTSFGFGDTHRFSSGQLRLGFESGRWQFGLGGNFLWTGRQFNSASENGGVFIVRLF